MNVKEKLYIPERQLTSIEAPPKSEKIHTISELLRAKQWIKNGFVLVPLLIQIHMPGPKIL
jgi:hypothetical protein